MNPFDHVAVAFSMVLSLGIVRLLDGLRPALAPGARYWVHTLWLFQKLLNHAYYWWVFGTLRETSTWNILSFLWVLLVPSLLFLQSTALVTTAPADVPSWRAHFFGIRRWFFLADAALILHAGISASVIRGLPLLHPLRAVQGAGLTLSVLGAASASPRLHAVIAPLALLLQSLGLGTLFFTPRALETST
jgi:hypothetical protein